MRSSILAAVVLLALPLAGARADAPKKGSRTWRDKCAICHGSDGKGQTEMGTSMGIPDFTAPAWQSSQTNAQINDAIANGISRQQNGKQQDMDAYAGKLKATQIAELVVYIRGLK